MMRGGWAAAIAVCLTGAPACGGEEGGRTVEGERGLPMAATFEGWVPGVDATLADHGGGHFLLDTGAPVTLADTDDFADLSSGWHDLDIELGELTFLDSAVGAFDVFTYQQTRAAPFSGIIGGDMVADFALSLDYQGGRVWLEDEPSDLPDGLDAGAVGDPITMDARVAGGGFFSAGGETREVGATRFLVRAEVEDPDGDDPIWLLVDTGASSVVLSNEMIDLLGDEGRPRLDGVDVGTAAGARTAYLTRVWNLRVGGAEHTSMPVLVLPDDGLFESISQETDLDVRGLVGGMFLRSYVATLDYAGESMRLLPYTSTDHLDPDEFIGVGFELAQDGSEWFVQNVFPGTDAAAQGVGEGDTVAELAGSPVAGLDLAEVEELLAPFGLGDALPVGLERGGEIESLEIAVEDLLPAFEAPQ
jgi:hypothetical protein